MRKRTLQPEQILVPGEYELGDEAILKIYFRIFEKGHGEDLPPVLVCNSTYVPASERQEFYVEKVRHEMDWIKLHIGGCLADYTPTDSVDSLLEKLEQSKRHVVGLNVNRIEDVMERIPHYMQRTSVFERRISDADYFLLDGNHRSAAAELTHQPLAALELQTEEDLAEIPLMTERGELFEFKRPETSLRKLYQEFMNFILGDTHDSNNHLDNFKTVKERIEELTSNGHLPKYMKEYYQKI